MTTSVHIINFGPEAVEVRRSNKETSSRAYLLAPTESVDMYVYNEQDIIISEQIDEKEKKD
jgi:hypothetical protein